ncbi:TonB-dependent siderophore receptor [Sporomusa sp. GT1]|uniref:TonB-dependent receptor plug domain-containing protein n=1 Tax=Sporomusa sp. GT1 TaxID=1534747 RepID=UPI001663A93C|nr:TonB-dependent receptor [Sporomusa sp. GT1]
MRKKWEKNSLALALTVGLALSSLNLVSAAAEEEYNFALEQVVVTATKTEKKVKEVPAAVEVITKEEMDKKNIKRVDDALRSITGIYVRQSKGVMGNTDMIGMRGFGKQKQVLVMIDGQPINDGYNTGVNLANIPTDNIERIEVIKGSASALYGSNAMGGVINIITQDKARQESAVRLGIGGQGTGSQSFYTSGSSGNFDYFITAQKSSVDGYVINPNKPQDGDNGMKRELYNGKLVYHVDDKSKVSLYGGSNDFKYFYTGNKDHGETNEDNWGLNYENQLSDTSSLKVSYGEKKVDYWYVSSNKHTSNPSKTTQGEVQYNFQQGDKDLITVGYSRRAEKGDSFASNVDIGGKTETHSFYIQDEHKISNNTTVYLGGRYDDWRFYDGYTSSAGTTTRTPETKANSFNPKIGVVHQMNDKLTLRSSIGKAFRAPNIYELAKDWEDHSNNTIYKCNPNLKPEEATNYEIGFDYQADKTVLAQVNIFHSDVSDAVDQKTSKVAGTQVKQFINSGKSRINGFEIGLNKRFDHAWSSFANYTYTDAKVISSDVAPENEGHQISGVPRQLFKVGVNYEKDRWQAGLSGNYVSETNDPVKRGKSGYGYYGSYFTVDTKVSYKMTQDTTISLSVDNVFDREYYSYYLTPSRTVYLELAHKF